MLTVGSLWLPTDRPHVSGPGLAAREGAWGSVPQGRRGRLSVPQTGHTPSSAEVLGEKACVQGVCARVHVWMSCGCLARVGVHVCACVCPCGECCPKGVSANARCVRRPGVTENRRYFSISLPSCRGNDAGKETGRCPLHSGRRQVLGFGEGSRSAPGCVSDQFERLACWVGWGFGQTGESACEGLGAPATGHLEEMKRPPVGWSPRVPCLRGVPPGLVCVCASPSLTSGGVTVLGSGDREFAGYNSNTTHESAQAVRAAQGGYWSCFAATPGPRKGRVEPPSETSVLTVSRPHEAFTHSLLHLIA